jgi:hypothetical protein
MTAGVSSIESELGRAIPCPPDKPVEIARGLGRLHIGLARPRSSDKSGMGFLNGGAAAGPARATLGASSVRKLASARTCEFPVNTFRNPRRSPAAFPGFAQDAHVDCSIGL